MGGGSVITAGAYAGATTVTPGVYYATSSLGVGGILTLDAQNNPDACFIFQINTTLITANGTSVVLINQAQANNVFWAVGTSCTLGTTTSFVGNIMTLASITFYTNAVLEGRALAMVPGSVTFDLNEIHIP